MIICSCNVISDRDVRSVIDVASPLRTAELYTWLGCSARCGRCARTIKRIIADAIKGSSLDCSPTTNDHGSTHLLGPVARIGLPWPRTSAFGYQPTWQGIRVASAFPA